jgi:hypothetical protein
MPAAARMIGTMFPPGRKRTYAFVAVSCGKLIHATSAILIELTLKVVLVEHHSECLSRARSLNTPGTS